MLSCLIVAGSMFLSGPYEAIRLDEIQRMKLIDRDLRVYTHNDQDTFRVTASEAERRPAQIVADCAERAEIEKMQLPLTSLADTLSESISELRTTLQTDNSFHAPTPLEAECEAEHYKFGARDVDMVRELCAGTRTDPAVPSEG